MLNGFTGVRVAFHAKVLKELDRLFAIFAERVLRTPGHRDNDAGLPHVFICFKAAA